MPYLKNIKIVYTNDRAGVPSPRVKEAPENTDVGRDDINNGFGGKFVWLVPEYTNDPEEAATSIELIRQEHANGDFEGQDLAAGAGGDFRYLKVVHDPTQRQRIMDVKLIRDDKPFDSTTLKGKLGEEGWKCTSDINKGRGGSYLWLAWKLA